MSLTPVRPRWRAVPAVALGLALVAGCGGSGGDTSADASDLLPEAEGSTEYPLTIDTWAGEQTIEERPERIAVIGFSTNLDFVEALDATPVYTITEEAEWAWRDQEWFSSIETIDEATRRDPINFEGIAAADPDVIIALNFVFEEKDFQQLSDIAPVVEYSEQLGDRADWREGQQIVGDVLDLGEAATGVNDDAEAALADVAAAHPEFEDKTITVATDYGESGFEYYTPTGGTAEGILTSLGFAANPLAEEFVDDPVISDENVGKLDADVLVTIYADDATREARESQQLFSSLPPVEDGRYVSLATPDGDPNALVDAEGNEYPGSPTWVLRRGASALSLPWAAEVVADEWLAGVDLS